MKKLYLQFTNSLQKNWNKFSIFSKRIKKIYILKFHQKIWAPLVYVFLALIVIAILIFLNIYFMANGKYSLEQINWVLKNWNAIVFDNPLISGQDFDEIRRGWYTVFATSLAAIGMVLAALAAQSLTRNPLAEGSTLGLAQSSMFGIVFVIWIANKTGLFGAGFAEIFAKFLSAIIFAIVAAFLLWVFIIKSKRQVNNVQKIILVGLAIGIIFKTLVFLFKGSDGNLNIVSYTFVLGGAEAIANEPLAMRLDDMLWSLIISAVSIGVSLLLTVLNLRGMNLLEIGDERAKNLGSAITRTRILNVLIVIFALPASVVLVGNMAFLGLFALHSARWLMRSRNFNKVLPTSLLVGILIGNLGMQLTNHLPQVNSGIWMTFIGAPYLIYLGIRGLK